MGNYTVICADTNLNVGTEEPATYIDRIKVPEEQLVTQCIPLGCLAALVALCSTMKSSSQQRRNSWLSDPTNILDWPKGNAIKER